MKLFVEVHPNSRQERVEKIDDQNFLVAVREPPVEGRANQAVQKALAGYFKVSASQVTLISGFSSRKKIFNLPV